MFKAFTTLPCLCLLALFLFIPAVIGAAEAPNASKQKTIVPPTVAETKSSAPIETNQASATTSALQQKEPGAAPIKIGYVNFARIGEETEVGKAAREKIRKTSESLEKQLTTRQKHLEKLKAAFQIKLSTLPTSEQEAKAKEFGKKVDEYRKFVQDAEKEMKGLEADVNRKIYQDIERAAITFGKANDYAAITIKRELLYVGSNVEGQDVTTEILKLLNAKREKK